ncbi:MAG: dephospho-CoA kinase [Cyanobacteriota bacterium]|nr:dephospho-CoA kinase [Cyanobacteriota bacterium]MEC8607281.1 dephospho-CoA kinase [Cyanobacteriota bacterium]
MAQRRIGLTGGIATGKSSAARLLEQHHGLPVLDADLYARQALEPGQPATEAVLERFGPGVVSSGGVVDRRALGAIVFNNQDERRWLEQLVHPIVRQRFDQELVQLDTNPAVVLMIPLLFESGLEALCSETWLVDCDESQQLQRLMARDQLNEAEAQARMDAQWPLARKRPLADVLISNRGDAAALNAQLEDALSP